MLARRKVPSNETQAVTELLLAEMYWKNMRVDYDGNNNPIYVGYNHRFVATEAEIDWVIQKINYTGTNADEMQVLTGSWTGRTTLGWGI